MRSVAVGTRHGLVLPPQLAPLSQSDIQTITHLGIPSSVVSPWQSAAGGVGRTRRVAELAAIGEGIERSAAGTIQIATKSRKEIASSQRIDAEDFCLFSDDQRIAASFPFANIYKDDCPYIETFSLDDNATCWIPQPFVTLQDEYKTGVPTSSGLAAGSTAPHALLRGIQELIERDALMTTWLHGLPGRRVATCGKHLDELQPLGGEIYTFDITPAYSPFSVALVAGGIQKQGTWRYSLGVACRESWQAAEEKAYLEWNQGVLFAGIYDTYVDTSEITDPYTLRTFDEHAIYYTLHPEQWQTLRLFAQKDTIHNNEERPTYNDDKDALSAVRKTLRSHNIRVYYRDITTIDAQQVGVHVVKATSPDMALIFAHQEWPFLNGVEDRLASCYPTRESDSVFPYLMPHPLG